MAGRYPDDRVCPGDQRTIDIFDSNTAELVCQLQDPAVSGIKSVSMTLKTLGGGKWRQERCGLLTPIIIYLQVNKFSPMGDVIGSGMGELSIEVI